MVALILSVMRRILAAGSMLLTSSRACLLPPEPETAILL